MISNNPFQFHNTPNKIFAKENLPSNSKQANASMSNWTEIEQVIIFEEFKRNALKWRTISETVENRSENSVKSFFYSSIRKIKNLRFLKYLKLMICFPTFRNNSNFHFFTFSSIHFNL